MFLFLPFLSTDRQLLLEQQAWLRWRIPKFNAEEYGIAALLGSGGQAITAIYFVGSALRARRYLSSSGDSESGTSGSMANRAAMQRLMRRVLTSGFLMLIITIVYGGGVNIIFHPVGFSALMALAFPMIMANSLLQLASFAPPAGAPPGPVEEARRVAVKCAMRFVVGNFSGGGGSFTTISPELDEPASDSRERNCGRVLKAKMLFVRSHGLSTLNANYKKVAPGSAWFTALENSLTGGRRSSRGWLPMIGQAESRRDSFSDQLSSRPRNSSHSAEASGETPPKATGCQKRNQQDDLAPCDRLGLSFSMLEAFATHYDITPEMTTTDVCYRYISPYTLKRKCCYLDLLAEEDPNRPDGWVGKTTHFASHWWARP